MFPVRFRTIAEAFGDSGRVRLYDSSGSDHSHVEESLTDLSDLVNSFLEKGSKEPEDFNGESVEDDDEDVSAESNKCRDYYETRDGLRGYFVNCKNDDSDEAKSRILMAVERALREVGNFFSEDFKRRLMARLRYGGFDAGLCKSKWEKNGRCPAGNYEYIDVQHSGNRYIVEVSLAKEFEIARSTACYEELLTHFPQIYVGKTEELKHVVKLMCKSMKKSMKTKEMCVPPWRRYAYVHSKWFGSYKRTTNEFGACVNKKSGGCDDEDDEDDEEEELRIKKSVGFVPLYPPLLYHHNVWRERVHHVGVDIGNNCSFKMGNLAAALQDTTAVLL